MDSSFLNSVLFFCVKFFGVECYLGTVFFIYHFNVTVFHLGVGIGTNGIFFDIQGGGGKCSTGERGVILPLEVN